MESAKIITDKNKKFQTFEGFGASGAWWAQEVGGWTETDGESGLSLRDRISQLLYHKEKGIGLRTYRYNMGAGSKESGRGFIKRELRRTESFLDKNGYDFSRDENAVYMMEQAVRDGAQEVILFVNSPVECLTENHMAHCDKNKPFRRNLSPKNYKAFAEYCLDVTEHFVSQGLPVKYLSPINEPLWKWTGGQEGCHYSPAAAGKVLDCFSKEMKKRPLLKDVKLSGAESGDIRWFNKSYTREMLRHKDVRERIDAVDIHSYFLPVPLPFFNNRIPFLKRFKKWMDKNYPGMPIKISEWTHMKRGRDKGMDSALVTARTIYEDIKYLNAVSWQHWIAVSEVDYCDGLIYINLPDKTFEITKRYYVTGNFSKYIPYGATRIEAVCKNEDLAVLAFVNGRQTVLIIINFSENEIAVTSPDFKGEITAAVTDKDNNLTEYKEASGNIKISGRSVNTLIFENVP